MEKEKLIIKNFGPIKEVDLDLGRFTILIGEQATGKSTVAKVLAVCRYFSYIVGDKGIYSRNNNPIYGGIRTWGLQEFIKTDSYIEYECCNYKFTAKNIKIPDPVYNEDDDTVTEYETDYIFTELTPKSIEFNNLFKEIKKIQTQSDLLSWKIPTSFFLNDVKNVMDNPFYLPTERSLQSIFSLGQGSIPNMANFLFNYFSKVDGILRTFTKETEIEPLGIFYVNQNGIGYVRKKEDDKFYLLANAASGYQSTIPVVLVMKYYGLQKRRKPFIIEETELNLFPTAQNSLMQYIVEKTLTFNDTILMTTQSPYILTSLNNMMYAYQIAQRNPVQIEGVIEKKYWLNPDEVSAYMMNSNGTAENIIDDEVKQIKAEKIDEISRKLNKEFDEMLNIEYNK